MGIRGNSNVKLVRRNLGIVPDTTPADKSRKVDFSKLGYASELTRMLHDRREEFIIEFDGPIADPGLPIDGMVDPSMPSAFFDDLWKLYGKKFGSEEDNLGAGGQRRMTIPLPEKNWNLNLSTSAFGRLAISDVVISVNRVEPDPNDSRRDRYLWSQFVFKRVGNRMYLSAHDASFKNERIPQFELLLKFTDAMLKNPKYHDEIQNFIGKNPRAR
jgi:hypothetical protein